MDRGAFSFGARRKLLRQIPRSPFDDAIIIARRAAVGKTTFLQIAQTTERDIFQTA